MALADFPSASGAFDPNVRVDVWRARKRDDIASVAFVIPVHNQRSSIRSCLDSIRECATLSHEIVVIVDGCTDGTDEVVRDWAQEFVDVESPLTTAVVVASTQQDVFETWCDVIGIYLSDAPVILEIQADMTVTERGFDAVFVRGFAAVPELFAASGRGGHEFRNPRRHDLWARIRRFVTTPVHRLVNLRTRRVGLYRPTLCEYLLGSEIGRTGARIDFPAQFGSKRYLWLTDTVMRGPLALRRDRYEMIGGFDTSAYFLGDDDHDLVRRAYADRGWVVGYLPVGFDSPLENGSTRAQKSPEQEQRYRVLREYYDRRQRQVEGGYAPAGRTPRRRYAISE